MTASNTSPERTIIMIEGPIGAGKTTVFNAFKESVPSAVFIEEPLNPELLKKFYDGKVSKFNFQLAILQARFKNLLEQIALNPDATTFYCDRYYFGDLAFAMENLTRKERMIYMYTWFAVYIHSRYYFKNREVMQLPLGQYVMENIARRGRAGEEAVTYEYQARIQGNLHAAIEAISGLEYHMAAVDEKITLDRIMGVLAGITRPQ